MRLNPKNLRARVGEQIDRAATGSEVPAGTEAVSATTRPGVRERGVLRRRVRRLRRLRDAVLIELGALSFEFERRGRREEGLLKAKVDRLRTIEDEIRGLTAALGEERRLEEVVAAGVAGACERCGALFSTDAHYCSQCGLALSPAARRQSSAPARGAPVAAEGPGSSAAGAPASVGTGSSDAGPSSAPGDGASHDPTGSSPTGDGDRARSRDAADSVARG